MAGVNAAATAVLLLLGSGAAAAPQDAASTDVYDYVQSRKDAVYRDVIADYEKAVRDNPGDVVAALRHCDAIEYFAYSEDFYNEAAVADAEVCRQDVRTKYDGHIEVVLQELQQRYDDFAARDIRDLIRNNEGGFNPSQVARLYLQLRHVEDTVQGNAAAAGHACLEALVRDVAADCRLDAAEHLHEHGQTDRAVQVLESPLDPRSEPYYRVQKIRKLSEFEAASAVARQFALLDAESLNDHLRVELSTSLATAGLADEALAMLAGVSEEYWNEAQLLQAQFDVAMTLGDFDAAHRYYYERQRLDYWNDPLLRQRFELAGADPTLGWRWSDLLGLGALLAMFGAVLLIALSVPAGVHYRGLVRRNKGLVPGRSDTAWTLRHAAYAIAAIFLLSVVSMYIFEYDLFFATYFGEYWEEPDWLEADLGRMLVLNAVVLAALISPLVLLKGRWRQVGPGNWSVVKCIGVGVGLAIVMRLMFGIPIALKPELFGLGDTLLTPEAVREIYVVYGFFTVLVVTSVLVPIVEEVSLRGMVLQGFTRHVTYGAANFLQSALFAGLHENWLLFPFYLVFGYVAGVIVGRAGGLLPAIIMHMVFNGIAVAGLAAVVDR